MKSPSDIEELPTAYGRVIAMSAEHNPDEDDIKEEGNEHVEDKATEVIEVDEEAIIDFSNSILKSFAIFGISSEHITSSINMVLELFQNTINYMEVNSAEIANTLLNEMLDYDETRQIGKVTLPPRHPVDDDGDSGGAGGGSGAVLNLPNDGSEGTLMSGIYMLPSNDTQANEYI